MYLGFPFSGLFFATLFSYFFGLNGYVAQPIDKIGDEFGLTHERVRQIKQRSLEKLKNTSGRYMRATIYL